MKALYRRYRSRSLAEVVGQEQVTRALEGALKLGKVSHSYLFVGPRGTGKTSVARILAHEVNGFKYELEDSYLDIIEIDAASNTGVDNIRDLREKAMIAPTEGKYKVYIIDEVHMLSKSAFNALLKTLEEPPEHVIFIMATTDAHKVPITIVSRSQKYVFRLASEEVMVGHLKKVALAEGIEIDEGALCVVARRSGGSFRDALSLLDQMALMSEGAITAESVEGAMGLPDGEAVGRLLRHFTDGESEKLISVLRELEEMGVGASLVAEELIARIVAEPKSEYMGLLEKLTGVTGGSFAEVKLLLALVGSGTKKVASGGSPVFQPRQSSSDSSVKEDPRPSEKTVDVAQKNAPQKEVVMPEKPIVADEKPTTYTWKNVVDGVRVEAPALGAHLSRLEVVESAGALTIYAKTKFIKGIIDKGLGEIVARVPEGTDVKVVPERKPVVDEKLRKISDIMGGIEEVKIDG